MGISPEPENASGKQRRWLDAWWTAVVGGGAGAKIGYGCLAKKTGARWDRRQRRARALFMGPNPLGGTASRGRGKGGLDGVGTVSDWDTSKRKEAGLTSGPRWSAGGGKRAVSESGWASEAGLRPKRRGEGEQRPGKEKKGLALGAACSAGKSGPAPEQGRAGLSGKEAKQAGAGKKRPRQKNRPTGPNRGKRKEFKFFLFLIFPKQVQNEISTQFEIRLQTNQYKILCNSMNTHSSLLTLYLVLFLIKLLFLKFKCP